VGDASLFGASDYSMRIWLDPERMRQRSLMPSDVISALQAQNARVAAGAVNMPPAKPGQDFQWTIDVSSDLAVVDGSFYLPASSTEAVSF